MVGVFSNAIGLSAVDQVAPETLHVKVIGSGYRWQYVYPGSDLVLDTEDDRYSSRMLFAPTDTKVQLHLCSEDYVYLLEIPKVGVYEIAAPDLKFEVGFATKKPGSYKLLGSQMCGYTHPDLMGDLTVQSYEDFVQTMKRLPTVPLAAAK